MEEKRTQYKVYCGGLPGSSKTTCGLSFPGTLEHHVWGVGEEETQGNFNRSDFVTVRNLWPECLSEKDRDVLYAPGTSDHELTRIEERAQHANILRYKKSIHKLRRDLELGKRPDLQTLLFDNLTPFADEFKSYIMIKYEADIFTREGNFDGRKFWPKYMDELVAFIRLIIDLPLNIVFTSHIALSVDEENAARVLDKDANRLPKEWLPNLDGKVRFALGGFFSYCFFLWVEETPGRPNRYFAKAEADDKMVGLAKCRLQPFSNPRRIELPKNNFYGFLHEAIKGASKSGPQSKKEGET
jgi:hypothetical protein